MNIAKNLYLTLIFLSVTITSAFAQSDDPDQQLAQLHAALDEAKDSGAIRFASADVAEAEKWLERADKACTRRQYGDCTRQMARAQLHLQMARTLTTLEQVRWEQSLLQTNLERLQQRWEEDQ